MRLSNIHYAVYIRNYFHVGISANSVKRKKTGKNCHARRIDFPGIKVYNNVVIVHRIIADGGEIHDREHRRGRDGELASDLRGK